MFQKTKGKDTKEYSVSNDDISTLARLVTGRELAHREYQYVMAGYETEINGLMEEVEKKLGIDTNKNIVDWQTVIKDGKIYVSPKPKEEPKVTTGKEEVNPNAGDIASGKSTKQEERKETGKSKR